MSAFLLAAAALGAASPAPAPVTVPPQPALTAAIRARDAELFDLFFLGCDPGRLRAMLTDDVEFYHDRDGRVFTDAAAMTADYAKNCADRAKPDAWRSRRELVAASLRVDPVPGYGAMEFGDHLFLERQGDGPEELVGRARFAMVWALGSDGQWRLARILSYAHEAAEAPGK